MTQKVARILIVDDDVSVALMIREVLEGEGHHVTTFHTGRDGVRVFSRERFDLVMQDVNLPGGVSGTAPVRPTSRFGMRRRSS